MLQCDSKLTHVHGFAPSSSLLQIVKIENPNWATSERLVVRRSKERENPKPKKPTKLKKVILEYRESNTSDSHNANEEILSPNVLKCLPPGAASKQCINKPQVPNTSFQVRVSSRFINRVHSVSRYCKQLISLELNKATHELLQELLRFQLRAIAKNPEKVLSCLSKSLQFFNLISISLLQMAVKKRMVYGLREVQRSVERRKAKCIIVAPNFEHVSSGISFAFWFFLFLLPLHICDIEGGLDEYVKHLAVECKRAGTRMVFAMTRNTLGKALNKRLRMMAVAILNYQGLKILIQAEKGVSFKYALCCFFFGILSCNRCRRYV